VGSTIVRGAVGFKSNSKSIQIQWFKMIQIFPNYDRSERYFPFLGKIKIKYGFEDLKEMNNFLHRNVLRFRMDLELKFREFSRLEFDRI
jgi:hypothetical protein